MPPQIAVITGPTATGKTALGILLAKALNGEVVSADSMQVYRHMDIGTAKPTPQEMDGVRHWMLDVVEPQESYSVARYVEDATSCVEDILSRGKLPIVVGGTGLYIDALIRGTAFSRRGDPEVRQQLAAEYDSLGGEAMLRRLGKVDAAAAQRLHPNDKKRIVRALEIFTTTGKTITEHDEETQKAPPRYRARKIALSFREREDLYARINLRVEEMFRRGLVDEVRRLLDMGVSPRHTAMQAIGYKEIVEAIRRGDAPESAAEAIKLSSRRYAKRQLSWLRSDSSVSWILWGNQPDFEHALQISTKYLEDIG
ncbi:MAG TPA: tRNA (adenosine(37)-N6)-dimethylallyltransferase MiaA [Papillibacter sp.]|jgi:tRNA dimethylallyltransferase|nr:tRNA (adenosine(37)-N6)-dimethylallyltransferase MiaA [Papillibacter sp.]